MNEAVTQHVAILAPRSAIADAVCHRILESGGHVAGIGRDCSGCSEEYSATEACALTDFEAVSEALSRVSDTLGGLTGIVNCAGSMLLKPAHLTSHDDYAATVDANLTTAFATVRAAKSIFKRSGGSVVLMSSSAAALGMGNHEAIAAAKAGVEGLTRSAAATYAPSGIRFNAVAPGLVETPLSEAITAAPSSRRISETLHPLGRLGTPEDIAGAICWLLDPAQSWVTGQVIGVDGGLSRVQPRPRVSAAKS